MKAKLCNILCQGYGQAFVYGHKQTRENMHGLPAELTLVRKNLLTPYLEEAGGPFAITRLPAYRV